MEDCIKFIVVTTSLLLLFGQGNSRIITPQGASQEGKPRPEQVFFQVFDGDSCTAENEQGTCKLISECTSIMTEIRNAGNPIPANMKRRLQMLACGFKFNQPMVCCPPTREPLVDRRGDIDGNPPDVSRHRNLNLLPTECGTVSEDDRIWGGNRTNLYEMPWMAIIVYDSGRGIKLSCGGTLITERYVLTAAHCISFLGKHMQVIGVLIGEYDIRSDPDCERIEGVLRCAPNARNASIERLIPHPGYSPQNLVDDIGLIKLAEPADFKLDNMKPICLPLTSELQKESLDNYSTIVAGWGATEDGLQSPVLLSVELPIVPNVECRKTYNGSPHIFNRQLCAGGVQDKDSCGGDSGGPLLYPGIIANKGVQYVQRGIVSYGSKRCGVGGYPGVYTRVSYYMDWILDNID